MRLETVIQLRQTAWRETLKPYTRTVRSACEAALSQTALGKSPGDFEMTVVLADDRFVRALNRDYRGQDKATNVLSFPSGNFPLEGGGNCFLGDVVLAYGTVRREAREQGKSLR